MSRPDFVEGVAVALAGSVLTGVGWTLLAPFLPLALLARLAVTVLAGGYLLYLLARGRCRVGRVSAMVAWLAMSAGLLLLGPPLLVHVLAQGAAVWLVRACVFQAGALAALADLALVALGVLAAAWAAVHTGSVALAAWCLLLVQAPFAGLPTGRRAKTSTDDGAEDRFEHAHRTAETALGRLATHR